MITKDYVSRETYKLLKEKGYDGEFKTCHDIEGYTYTAIHLYDAMKWLREKHDIFIEIMIFDEEDRIGLSEDERYCWSIHYNSTGNIRPFDGIAKTPEEASEAGIKYCLENLI